MNSKRLKLLFLPSFCAFMCCLPAQADVYDFVYGGPPKAPDDRDIRILENPHYAVGYEDDNRNPAWVAYKYGRQNRYFKVEREKGSFDTDNRTRSKVTDEDYDEFQGTYQRGHVAPSYGMGIFFGKDGQNETFKMTNVLPQPPNLNAGIWRGPEYLEAQNYGKFFDDLWVVAGPIYDDNFVFPNGIRRPSACFKIYVMEDANSAPHSIAFIFPEHLDTKEAVGLPKIDTANRLYKWVLDHCTQDGRQTTVKEVEERTGLKFFTELPKPTIKRLENSQEELWDTSSN